MLRPMLAFVSLALVASGTPTAARAEETSVAVYRVVVGEHDEFFAACGVTATNDGEWGLAAFEIRGLNGALEWVEVHALKLRSQLTLRVGVGAQPLGIALRNGSSRGRGVLKLGLHVWGQTQPRIVRWACVSRGALSDSMVRLNGVVVPAASSDPGLLTVMRLDELGGGVSLDGGYYGRGASLGLLRAHEEVAAGHFFGLLWLPLPYSEGRIVAPDGTESAGPVVGVSTEQEGRWEFVVDRVVGDAPADTVLWVLRSPEGL